MHNVRADYAGYRRDKPTLLRVILLSIINAGFRAVVLYRIGHCCRKRGLTFAAAICDRLNFKLTHCIINSSAMIGPGFRIAHVGGIVIGGKTVIGSNCHIRHGTTFGGNWSKTRENDPTWSQPRVGDNVVIGCGAVILGPIVVGSNSRIGANAVIIRDVSEGGTYAGNPARRLK